MTELKRTRTIEETYGYQAFDGRIFATETACRDYEANAENVIGAMAKNLLSRPEEAVENFVHCYGYEDTFMVWNIKDTDQLQIVNQFLRTVDQNTLIGAEYIGKRICVSLSREHDWYNIMGTREEMIARYAEGVDRLFADPTDEEVCE